MNGTAARRATSTPAAHASNRAAPADFTFPISAEDLAARSSSGRMRVGLTRQFTYVAIDLALVCAGGLFLFWLDFGLQPTFTASIRSAARFFSHVSAPEYPGFLLLYAALIVLACKSQHLYRTLKELTAVEETFTVVKAVCLATALLVLFIFTSGNREISRTIVLYAGALNIVTLSGWRFAKRRYVFSRAQQGESASRVLIVRAGQSGRAFASWLAANRHLGYSVCGFIDAAASANPNGHASSNITVDADGTAAVNSDAEAPVLGSLEDLRRIALAEFIDQLFIALPADRDLVKQVFLEARRLRLDLHIVPDIYDGLGWHAPVHAIGGFQVLELYGQPIPAVGLATKRIVDAALGSVLLILAAPILAAAAAWISLDSPGPILYSAPRVGRKGKKFRCHKLRTMISSADESKDLLRSSNQRNGPFFKIANDPRITRSGRWLRRFSIDELPQLFNVIVGNMSLVGPRPHPLDDVKLYRVEDLRRLDVKPGLTGLWQVAARRDPSFETNMHLDLQYIENWSLALDARILLRTIPAVLRGEGN
jgi:exopolysaccharide biosynthesis polyprenyl glycosylphosphotransferase